MQTLALVLLFVSGVSFTYAQSGGPASQPQPIYGMAPSPPNPAQSCITDICGPPAQTNLYMTKYMDRLNEYVKLAADPKHIEYSPTIVKLVADIQTENRAQYMNAVSIFRKSTSLGEAKPDGLSKAFYNIIAVSPLLKKVKYKTSNTNGVLEAAIDEKATLAELKGLSLDDRRQTLQIAKSFLSIYKVGSVSEGDVQTQPVQLLLKQLHPKFSVAEAMKLELQTAQAKITSLNGLSPLEKAIYFNNTSPDRIAFIATHVANGTVDENETREILRWNIESTRNDAFYRSPNSPVMSREAPPVEEIIKKGGGVEAIAQRFEKDREADQQKDFVKIQDCKLQYFLNKGLLPTKTQLDTLNRDIKRGKDLVIEMIKSKFPTSSQQKLISAVEAADFVTPPSAAEFERSFENSLRQKLQLLKENAASMNSIPEGEMRQLISVISMAKSMEDSKESKGTSTSYCDAFKYSPMSDANYTTFGSIMLSFTTATGDETSRMKTIMHELGHTISKTIADDPAEADRFRGVRRCLGEQHTEEYPAQTKKRYQESVKANRKADTPYAEEDFADSVAGESGTNVQGKNGWCQFLGLSPDRQQFAESKMQAEDFDSHSSSLFRLLNFEKMKKGGLPGSCSDYLTSIKYKEHFAQCLDLSSSRKTSPARADGVIR